MPTNDRLEGRYQCPGCGHPITTGATPWRCTGPDCGNEFPVVDGVPVLLDARFGLSPLDYVPEAGTAPKPADDNEERPGLRGIYDRVMPKLSKNWVGPKNVELTIRLLKERAERPLVLVLGGRVTGGGMERMIADPDIELVETDLEFGGRARYICDAQRIPFADATFDGVIVQGVLCYLSEPWTCVSEVHRVLKPSGVVYSEVPFMQQVTGGAYDFVRFSEVGQRHLFKAFDLVSSGPVAGPGMGLAWAYAYLLMSFATGRVSRSLLFAFASVTGFWLKYLDPMIMNRPAARDAATGFYFVGSRLDEPVSYGEVLEGYHGAVRWST